jgi:hypothetical protein
MVIFTNSIKFWSIPKSYQKKISKKKKLRVFWESWQDLKLKLKKNWKMDTLKWYFLNLSTFFFKSNKKSRIINEVLPK